MTRSTQKQMKTGEKNSKLEKLELQLRALLISNPFRKKAKFVSRDAQDVNTMYTVSFWGHIIF